MTLEEFYYTEKVLLDQFYAKYKNGRLPAGILKSETDSYDRTNWEILFHFFVIKASEINETTQP